MGVKFGISLKETCDNERCHSGAEGHPMELEYDERDVVGELTLNSLCGAARADGWLYDQQSQKWTCPLCAGDK